MRTVTAQTRKGNTMKEQTLQMTQEQRERELVKHAMGNVVMAMLNCTQVGLKRNIPASIILLKTTLTCHQILSEAQKDERPDAFIECFDEMVESGELQEINESMGQAVESLKELSDRIYSIMS